MRARVLKPGFFTNEHLARLPVRARLLFAGLWCLADREGRLEDRPERIKAAIFPYERVRIAPLIATLERAGFVKSYTAAYTRCLALPQFAKHQHPHHREGPSLLPPPPIEPRPGPAWPLPGPAVPVPVPVRDQDQDLPSAARPVFVPDFRVYCAIAKGAIEEADRFDLGEFADRFKTKCAKARLPLPDLDITRRAIDAVLHARQKRRQAQ